MAINPVTIVSKGIGIIAAGMILHDAHKVGKAVRNVNRKSRVADNITDEYMNNRKMPNFNLSLMNAKNHVLRFKLDNNFPELGYGVEGYIKGFKIIVTDNILPALLATGAILSGKFAGRMCALGLLLYGAKILLYDVLSVSKPKQV